MLSNYSVVFSGAQGTGKSTLSHAWAKHAGIEFKAIQTRDFLPDGIGSHLDILKLAITDPGEAINFQSNLIKMRAELFSRLHNSNTKFTSDRAVFDSFAYYTVHNSMFASNMITDELELVTDKSVWDYDITVVLDPKQSTVDDNCFRVVNPGYSRSISRVMFDKIQATYDSEMGDLLKANLKAVHHKYKGMVTAQITHIGKALVTLHEPDGMIPTEARIELIEAAVRTIDALRTQE